MEVLEEAAVGVVVREMMMNPARSVLKVDVGEVGGGVAGEIDSIGLVSVNGFNRSC